LKLWLSISVTALIAAAVVAPSASAEKPVKEPVELEPDEFAAGEVCPFPILVDPTDVKAWQTTFSNGRALFQAKGTMRVKNTHSGGSVSLRVAGPVTSTVLPNGDVRSTARGRVLLFYFAGDVIGPTLHLTIGRVVEIFDADTGLITSSELSGKRIDVCAQLS
jgi:hypothetical protein